MKRNNKSRVLAFLLAVAVVIIIILILLLLRSCSHTSDNRATPDSVFTTEDNTGDLDFTPYEEKQYGKITIPAVNGMIFYANQLQQAVDFLNPKSNNCYFIISLYLSDGTLLYKSDYLAPSEKITQITLNQTLDKGLYKNCKLLYNCYSLDDLSPLNNGETVIEINSI